MTDEQKRVAIARQKLRQARGAGQGVMTAEKRYIQARADQLRSEMDDNHRAD